LSEGWPDLLEHRPYKDVSDEDLETMLAAAKAFKAQREGAQDNGLKGVRPQKYKELRQTEHSGRVELSARPFKDMSDEDLETMLEAAKAYKALKEVEGG
jgi:hypothetical protein